MSCGSCSLRALRQLHFGTVRDGVNLARLGIPAVALVTEDFGPKGTLWLSHWECQTYPGCSCPIH